MRIKYDNIIEALSSENYIIDVKKIDKDVVIIPDSDKFTDEEMNHIAEIINENSTTSDIGLIRKDMDKNNSKKALYVLLDPNGIIGYIEYYGRLLELSKDIIERSIVLSEELDLSTRIDACVTLYITAYSDDIDLYLSNISELCDVEKKKLIKRINNIEK